ncbi:MAG: signal peptide peptidase SppA [Opitutaceae bacterium]|jgi:protease-4
MKNFFTSMLGALVALVVFSAGAILLFIGLLGAIISMSGDKKSPTIDRGSYLVFDLAANITDSPPQVDFSQLTGGHSSTLQLRTLTHAIRAAKSDDRVAGILLKGALTPAGYGSGYAVLKEVRNALTDFKASGKPVRAYLEAVTTKDYYLASVASDIAMDPYGMIVMPGLASEPMFYAGAFEKFGIGVQVTRVGKYKSFIEPYTRKDMSPENREQTLKLLNDLWGSMIDDMARSRSLTPEKIQFVVDAEGIIRPEKAKASKLVDRIAYRDEIISELRTKTGPSSSDKITFKQIEIAAYAKITKDIVAAAKKPTTDESKSSGTSRGKVAVIYAEGSIVDGDGERGEIGGVKFARELRSLRQDDAVKAIVLRVNSPGGSASASENIAREVRLARKVKPVIISMGSYAASGGYWIAADGDRIFAEPTTITGSIGVFGLQFDVQKLANNVGLTFDVVKTGKYADAITITRPKTDAELAIFQNMVDWIYGEFIGKVAEARKLKKEDVQDIAQGRVWSGAEAKKLGLVDELGGLDDAIQFAVTKAGLGKNYRLIEYPQKKELAETIGELVERFNPDAQAQANGVVGQITARLKHDLATLKSFNDPQGIYARMPLELSLR